MVIDIQEHDETDVNGNKLEITNYYGIINYYSVIN